jgi:hypothetical protein
VALIPRAEVKEAPGTSMGVNVKLAASALAGAARTSPMTSTTAANNEEQPGKRSSTLEAAFIPHLLLQHIGPRLPSRLLELGTVRGA